MFFLPRQKPSKTKIFMIKGFGPNNFHFKVCKVINHYAWPLSLQKDSILIILNTIIEIEGPKNIWGLISHLGIIMSRCTLCIKDWACCTYLFILLYKLLTHSVVHTCLGFRCKATNKEAILGMRARCEPNIKPKFTNQPHSSSLPSVNNQHNFAFQKWTVVIHLWGEEVPDV